MSANVSVHPQSHLASKFAYGITIFTSAFLLFNVESIIANIILAGWAERRLWRSCVHDRV